MNREQKLQEVYNEINKNWIRAQKGELSLQGRKEYPLIACEVVYELLKNACIAPAQHKVVALALKEAEVPITHANARMIMVTVKDVFELKCKIGVTGRNSTKPKERPKHDKVDMAFNRFVNRLFDSHKVNKRELKQLCRG